MRHYKADVSHRIRRQPSIFTARWFRIILGGGVVIILALLVGPPVAGWLRSQPSAPPAAAPGVGAALAPARASDAAAPAAPRSETIPGARAAAPPINGARGPDAASGPRRSEPATDAGKDPAPAAPAPETGAAPSAAAPRAAVPSAAAPNPVAPRAAVARAVPPGTAAPSTPTPGDAAPRAPAPGAAAPGAAAAKARAATGDTVFRIQVGAFRDHRNAERLSERLRREGLEVVTGDEESPSIRYRVVAVPADGSAIGGLLEHLRGLGLGAEARPSGDAVTQPLVLGAAIEASRALREQGVRVRLEREPGGNGLRAVRVGAYGSAEDAERARTELASRGYAGFVVRDR
jgi:cell division protein FtsN